MWDKKLFWIVFIRRSSSIIGCLSSKVVFHQRPSSIKGCLPWKLAFLDGMPLLLCKICLFTKYEPHFRPQTLSKVWWGGWVDCGNLLGPNLWLGAWSLDQAQQYILECVKLYKILNLANEIKKNNSFLDNHFYIFNMNMPLHNLILFGSITRLNGTTGLRCSILK